ncbi:MAG: hypothetical protein C0404_03985 [Verrucomicrobia bacterium]|nr:hypothetical protein [Verrucomicrobiota bacterium]
MTCLRMKVVINLSALLLGAGVLMSGCGGGADSGKPANPEATKAPAPAIPESLNKAIERGDVQAVLACLASGASVTEQLGGESPIHAAARSGKREIVEALLAKGADPKVLSQRGYTALHLASTRDVAELLMEKGLGVNETSTYRETPLCMAADGAYAEVVAFLLSRGADPKARARDADVMPLNYAATRAIAERLVAAGAPAWGETNQWGRNTPPLWTAASKGRTEVVAYLLDAGIPPPPARGMDEYLTMALFHAVRGRHSGAVDAILDRKGARLDARKSDEFMTQAVRNSDTNTVQAFISKGVKSTENYYDPLIAAAGNGDAGILKLILDAGGLATAGSWSGYTPLHAACKAQKGPKEGYLSCMNLLLSAGADAKAATKSSKQTPLHFAAGADFIAGATILVQKGADVNARDEVASAPLHWAVINDAVETVGFLLSNGANPNLAVSEKAAVHTTRPGDVPNPFGGKAVGAQVPLTLAKSEAMKALLRKHGATESGTAAAPAPAAPPPAPVPAAQLPPPPPPPVVTKQPAQPAQPVSPPAQPQPPVVQEIRKVKVGDTEAEVTEILGTPQGRKKSGAETTLFFKGGDVTIVDGKVTAVIGQPRKK